MNDFQKNIIPDTHTALQALEALNMTGRYTNLFVLNESGVAIGSVTDGDIRRGLIKGMQLPDPVTAFMNRDFRHFCTAEDSISKLQAYREEGFKLMPVLDESRKLIRIIALDMGESFLPVEAVIMAGGLGKRLHPLTLDIPKPLLKIGNKSIIEYSIDRLIRFGVQKIHISVNYKKDQVMEYLGDGSSRGISIEYLHETEPLGTIGALAQLGDFSCQDLLVMNSDLLTNIDFEAFYISYREKGADMAIATVPYHIDVPYAIMELSDSSEVVSFMEKPRFTYYSNAGIYCISKASVARIPQNQKYDAPDLILEMMKSGRKVVSEPILGYWLDIGRHEDFERAQNDVRHILF